MDDAARTIDLEDRRIFRTTAGTLDGWVALSLDSAEDPAGWARTYLTAAAPDIPPARMLGAIAHLASATRIVRAGIGIGMARAYQPDVTGPVEAMWSFSMVPIEYASGPLEEAVRIFERQGRPVGADQRELLTLPAGQAARVHNACAQRAPGRFPWRGETVTDGVTYLIQPNIADDYRLVLDTWWTALELSEVLALHSRLMAESLEVTVREEGS
jgi:hypothetical protein